mmetsp:Transcript_16092/g.30402  ORF Transcript_16092/g.30402 Transcript_16092/m.30402 type:complete len:695 (-) Transcript_16092:2839-4923(-)
MGKAKKDSFSFSSSSREKTNTQEIQESKSAAEFFAENQAIAGFDNVGKSLYTTIRELVENALDACESVNILPDIVIKVEEMNQMEFNKLRGLHGPDVISGATDEGLFQKQKRGTTPPAVDATVVDATSTPTTGGNKSQKKSKNYKNEEAYFRISVRDNGCGMTHDVIPNLLGRVLSGSKYGVRQTRGKFGLGAKMALIWSKKSTGVPIKIRTCHISSLEYVTTCVLDIDIYKNAPKVLQHDKKQNVEDWRGTDFEVIIAGSWNSYKSRILQYLQQLAIITPYAKFELQYSNVSNEKRNMTIRYDRRSEQMPPPAREVKHHPSSVNNLLVQQLLDKSNCNTLLKFLCEDLSGISPSIAKRIIAELGSGFDETMKPLDLNDKQITKLVQMLRSVELFKPPDGSCLSPLGEYNLNLGILKVIEPDIVATSRDKPSAYEGHPFIVEAAIALGGKHAKEGITVIRYANRIPLLFEGGADVSTRVAQSKIKWNSYKIDQKKDKISVFVSIVSTKIPFKGTGKEYIGDDITEIQTSVKRALQNCCQQLRSQLTKRNAIRDAHQRKSRLVKYVPDVSKSIFGILDEMRKRKMQENQENDDHASPMVVSSQKRQKTGDAILSKLDNNIITQNALKSCLEEAIESHNSSMGGKDSQQSKDDGKSKDRLPTFLVPITRLNLAPETYYGMLFMFKPLAMGKNRPIP